MKNYGKWVDDENNKTKEEMIVHSTGKINPKKHIQTVITSDIA